MSPTDPIGWKQLKTQHSARQQPKLFYLFKHSGSGLTLHLTDQIRLWQCSLTKAGINSKAAEQHCSIDPSESADQMNVFLCKLEESLQAGKNRLIRAAGSENDDLCLFTQISLPHPLPPLAFFFKLHLASPSLFSRTVVQPALATIAVLQSQLLSLEHHIKDKDHIISKLLDRIKSQSVDMSMIFPTLTGAGGRNGTVTVEMAKKRIAGMEAFDHEAWANDFDGLNGELVRVGELLKGVRSEASGKDVDEDWMRHLPSLSPAELAKMNTSQSQSQTRSQDLPGNDQENVTSEDEFERQATPPSLRKKRASPHIKETLADQTSSSDRGDTPPPAKKQRIGGLRRKRPATMKPEELIPNVESEASSAQTPDNQQPHPPSRSLSPVSEGTTETASSSSAEDKPTTRHSQQSKQKMQSVRSRPQKALSPSPAPAERSTSSPQPPSSFHASTPSRRLGRLGKKKSHQRTSTASPPPEANTNAAAAAAAASQSAITSTTPTKRLGRIGRNKQAQPQSKSRELVDESATASDDNNDDDNDENDNENDLDPRPFTQTPRKSPTATETKKADTARHPTDHSVPPSLPSPPQPLPPPAETKTKLVETEEQKAARRKEELRKTIASGPTKKKRRF